ncbi:asparagine synthase (glutamine-hydrolyzing) [Desulfosarcina sp.]|uniref:asparagine synthase (glutamine-hydrolyzing) n=1 Tax=Desulfosarcina sp. TaxID=2027861 RepID=UPI0039706EBC
MCGIVGFVSKRHFNRLKIDLTKAASVLSHRGPDDQGLYFDESWGLALAHRRLSIIDLSIAGHQPMVSDDGDTVIVFNGEVYNFLQVKSELITAGHRFKSTGDTEVVLKAYMQWGLDCLHKFIGMFAFAIWDKTNRRLFAARDRLGIKPLYYSYSDGQFLFGSELKALMAFSRFQRRVDSDAFSLYLHYQYVPVPRTIFENTFKLQPGYFLLFDGKNVTTRQWWRIPGLDRDAPAPEPSSEEESLSRLDELLVQAVSDRLVSDVPLGAMLSGGVDSSIVVALMQKLNQSPVRTYSIGFEEDGYDEAPWARRIADHLGTEHTQLYVSARDALQVIPQLPEIFDEPFADSSAIPTYLVSKLTRGQVTVALSGDGGDEQFAGYARYWITANMARWVKRLPSAVINLLREGVEKIPATSLSRIYSAFRSGLPQWLQVENFSDKWSKIVSQMSQTELAELYRMAVCTWAEDDIRQLTGQGVPPSTYDHVFDATGHLDAIRRMMLVDQQTYLPDDMLTKVDRASMAASLEVRVPLLDHRVVAFSARLPVDLKYRNGRGKYLLRKLLCRYIPGELIERPKMGFGVPIADWLRKDLNHLLKDYLSPAHLRNEGRFDPDFVDTILNEHMAGSGNHRHRLWSLLMWEMWREKWLV